MQHKQTKLIYMLGLCRLLVSFFELKTGVWSVRQTVWIQIRPDIQAVCKGYQQTANISDSKLEELMPFSQLDIFNAIFSPFSKHSSVII